MEPSNERSEGWGRSPSGLRGLGGDLTRSVVLLGLAWPGLPPSPSLPVLAVLAVVAAVGSWPLFWTASAYTALIFWSSEGTAVWYGAVLTAGVLAALGWMAIRERLSGSGEMMSVLRGWFTARPRAMRNAAIAALVLVLLFRGTPALAALTFVAIAAGLAAALSGRARSAPRRSLKENWASVGLLALGIVLGAMVLEVCIRRVLPAPPAEESFWMPHEEAEFALRPNSEGVTRNLDKDTAYAVQIGPHGYRDRAYSPKADDEFRIMVVGDSFAFGAGEPLEATVAKQLESMLRKAPTTKRVSVINAGVTGYGPIHELIMFRERGLALEPDLVILQLLPANDIENCLAMIGKYPESFFVTGAIRQRMFRYQSDWRVRLDTWLKRRWHTYYWGMAVLGQPGWILEALGSFRAFPPLPDPEALKMRATANRPGQLEINLRKWYPTLEEGWGLFREAVREFEATCRARGIDFIAYAQPNKATVSDAAWDFHTRNVDDDLYERGKEIRIVHDFFREADIPFVDVHQSFQGQSGVESLFHGYDTHLTPEGNRLVAQTLYDYLRDEYLGARGLVRDGSIAQTDE